ncbi:MAG TPA: MFS transporter [Pseudonocardiaceae bacterium]|nr:MFS transporter [Pseudonocardiaceae bacterium]
MTTPQEAPQETGAGWSPRLWGLLFVLSGNMLLDALEVSVVIVALPSIGHDLHLSPPGAQWMMSGFALGFGGLLLFGGRVVALLGRRRVYLAALAVFAVASLVAGLVPVAPILIVTRVVKGCCAALTAPTGLAIIGSTFAEGADRNRAVSVYSLFGAAGFSVGLVLSGLFTQLDWRWVFLFPAPIALLLFVFGSRLIPRDTGDEHAPRRYDGPGALCFAAAAALVLYTIVTGATAGWSGPLVIGGGALAVASLVAAIHIERHSTAPLIRFALLARGPLIRSSLGAGALNGSFWGFLLIATFQLQTALGWSPWQTALAFLPASIVLAFSAPFAGKIVGRFGAPWLITLGALAPPIGYVRYLSAGPSPSYGTAILPTMLLIGLGFVLAFAALNIQATSGVPGQELPMAIGTYQTSVQIGGAVMLAAVAALLGIGYRPALLLVTVVGVAGFLVALTGVFPPFRGTRPTSPGTN